MDLVVPLFACQAVGAAIAVAWLVRSLSRNINTDAYIGIVVKLIRAGDVARARKLSAAADQSPVARMVDAMLAVSEQPYDNEEIVRLALKDAFENTRAAELAGFGTALPGLAIGLLLLAIPAAVAGALGLPYTDAFAVIAIVGGVVDLAAGRTILQIRSARFERMAPIVDAMVAMKTGGAKGG